jgi:ubiquinone/menaquinone biosynthesis C-methylase UbiE
VTATFDLTASTFERHRALPAGVPEAVRQAIWDATGARRSGRVLDVGAGSGRFGRTFAAAGDHYIGIDTSLAMLREFHGRATAACLFQADGESLPFRDDIFELILLMQVLSGTNNWRKLLVETARVIVPGGFVVVGQTSGPTGGIDKQMKRQLRAILQELGADAHDSEATRKQALELLASGASRQIHALAASWTAQRTPREFLERHRTAARFSALSAATQEQALKTLAGWAEKQFKSLDQSFTEEHNFELEIFRIGRR